MRIARTLGVSEPVCPNSTRKCRGHVDDATPMDDAGNRPLGPRNLGEMEPGNRMLLLVEDLDRKLRSLSGALDARDEHDLRQLAYNLAEAAREDLDCDLIGLDDDDDGLLDEMQLSSVTERADDLIAFCRAALENCEQEYCNESSLDQELEDPESERGVDEA